MKRLFLLCLLPGLVFLGCSQESKSYDLSTPDGAISEYLRVQAEGDIPGYCRVLTKNTQIYLILSLGSSQTNCRSALEERKDAALKVMSTTAEYLRLEEIRHQGANRAVAVFDSPRGQVTRELVRQNGLWRVQIIPSG